MLGNSSELSSSTAVPATSYNSSKRGKAASSISDKADKNGASSQEQNSSARGNSNGNSKNKRGRKPSNAPPTRSVMPPARTLDTWIVRDTTPTPNPGTSPNPATLGRSPLRSLSPDVPISKDAPRGRSNISAVVAAVAEVAGSDASSPPSKRSRVLSEKDKQTRRVVYLHDSPSHRTGPTVTDVDSADGHATMTPPESSRDDDHGRHMPPGDSSSIPSSNREKKSVAIVQAPRRKKADAAVADPVPMTDDVAPPKKSSTSKSSTGPKKKARKSNGGPTALSDTASPAASARKKSAGAAKGMDTFTRKGSQGTSKSLKSKRGAPKAPATAIASGFRDDGVSAGSATNANLGTASLVGVAADAEAVQPRRRGRPRKTPKVPLQQPLSPATIAVMDEQEKTPAAAAATPAARKSRTPRRVAGVDEGSASSSLKTPPTVIAPCTDPAAEDIEGKSKKRRASSSTKISPAKPVTGATTKASTAVSKKRTAARAELPTKPTTSPARRYGGPLVVGAGGGCGWRRPEHQENKGRAGKRGRRSPPIAVPLLRGCNAAGSAGGPAGAVAAASPLAASVGTVTAPVTEATATPSASKEGTTARPSAAVNNCSEEDPGTEPSGSRPAVEGNDTVQVSGVDAVANSVARGAGSLAGTESTTIAGTSACSGVNDAKEVESGGGVSGVGGDTCVISDLVDDGQRDFVDPAIKSPKRKGSPLNEEEGISKAQKMVDNSESSRGDIDDTTAASFIGSDTITTAGAASDHRTHETSSTGNMLGEVKESKGVEKTRVGNAATPSTEATTADTRHDAMIAKLPPGMPASASGKPEDKEGEGTAIGAAAERWTPAMQEKDDDLELHVMIGGGEL